MRDFFKELLEYSHHCNQKLAGVFVDNPDQTSEKSVILFSHILNAHHIWNYRIASEQPTFGVWQIHSIHAFKEIDRANYEHSLLILDKFDLEVQTHYANTKGELFTNSVRDILFHTINHSTYHRGQIATEFKQSELVPLVTDYIVYKR